MFLGGRRRGDESGDWKRGRREAYPFSIAVFMFSIRFVQIHAIETADSESEDELYEAVDRMGDVPKGHFTTSKNTHLVLPVIESGFFVRRVDSLRMSSCLLEMAWQSCR